MKKHSKADTNICSSSKSDDVLNEDASNKKRKSRRRLIQMFTAGGVVASAKSIPGKWSSPIVDAVALPVHAETTCEVIELGNDRNFLDDFVTGAERAESLLASGVDRIWGGLRDTLIEQTYAQDTEVGFCEPTGCASIRYLCDETMGQLTISVFDNTADSNSLTMDVILNFKDGQIHSLDETCFGPSVSFVVNLISNSLATLTIMCCDNKLEIAVDLVTNFICEPADDLVSDDT